MVIAASAFALVHEPITPSRIAHDTGVDLTLIKTWVTHVQPYEDASGYRVFFRASTPAEVRELIPRMTPTHILIVLAT